MTPINANGNLLNTLFFSAYLLLKYDVIATDAKAFAWNYNNNISDANPGIFSIRNFAQSQDPGILMSESHFWKVHNLVNSVYFFEKPIKHI